MLSRRALIAITPVWLLAGDFVTGSRSRDQLGPPKENKEKLQLTPEYIAESQNNFDDENKIRAAISAMKSDGKRVVDLGGRTYQVGSRVVVEDFTLRNFRFIFTDKNASVRLTGVRPGLENFEIEYAEYDGRNLKSESGVVNLHMSIGATIANGKISGTARRVAIKCTSNALDTTIDGLVSYASWGILFDDKNSRVIDMIDYSHSSLGRGLHIKNCYFYGDQNHRNSGDGIEVNTPRKRFENVEIEDCIVFQTVSSPSVGLGIAFAGVDGVVVRRSEVRFGTSPAGAFHVERSKNVLFENCIARNSYSGMSVGMCDNVSVVNCEFHDCLRFGIQSFNTYGDKSCATLGSPTIGLVIKQCMFSGTGAGGNGGPDIIIGRIRNVSIVENIFHISHLNNSPTVKTLTFDGEGVIGLVFVGNKFVFKSNIPNHNLVEFDSNTVDVAAEDNVFSDNGAEDSFLGLVQSTRGAVRSGAVTCEP